MLTKNAGNGFSDILSSISKQKFKNFEVIIIDSGSKDRTLEIAGKFPVRIYQIKPEEFGHGKTRNLGAKLARGKFVVYLTQDAIPANNLWLGSFLKNFKDKRVAGAFSRQIPRKNASLLEGFFCDYHYPKKKIIRSNESRNLFLDKIFFSNVSSCIRKNILRKFKFNEGLIMSEDQQWARDVFKAGYNTIYEPSSIVYHSHNYRLKTVFQRYFDSAFSLKIITKGRNQDFASYARKYMLKEFLFIFRKSPPLIPYLMAYNTAKILGSFFGLNEQWLPLFLKKEFSLHKNYWNKK